MSELRSSSHHRSSRALFLRILPILSVILIDVFFLLMLDNLFYNKKRALILDPSENQKAMLAQIDPIRLELPNVASDKAKKKKKVQELAPQILAQENPWFRIRLINPDNTVEYEEENPEKFQRFNDWSNCFLSRSFESISSTPVNDNRNNLLFTLVFYYTSPKGWPGIEGMVIRFWVYALAFIIVSWAVFIGLSRTVLRPLERVGQAIEDMIQSDGVVLIQRPIHAIEYRFNQLARNQREVLFGLEIERIVDELHSLADDLEVVERFLQGIDKSVRKIYPFERVDLYIFSTQSNAFLPIVTDCPAWPIEDSSDLILVESGCAISLKAGETIVGGFFCVASDKNLKREEIAVMASELKKQAENGLARAFTRSRTLTEERNRFGINLATNMGHDLTNIIASGKWDLDTIQRAQNRGIVTMDPQKGSFFLEAVDGLRNNLHFLQEMVDIYRSFGYTRSPRYEWIQLAELIEQVATLFRRSSSQKLSVHISMPEEIEIFAEPRLLRMALFNLLANSAQAIRRSDPRMQGVISISVTPCENHKIILSLSDNGPGIRDKAGNLLENHEIRRIFQSGYSTKEGNSGGGLGLSWVQSIVEDFHHGSIQASNSPEGGAQFSMTIPLVEQPPYIDEQKE